MVTVKDFAINNNRSNETFISLILQGEPEVIQSKQSGNFYVTTKTCRLPSTLDEVTAKLMVGKSMQGSIQKVPCEPYEYTVSDTGEIITLDYRYEYSKEDVASTYNHFGKNTSDFPSINSQTNMLFVEEIV